MTWGSPLSLNLRQPSSTESTMMKWLSKWVRLRISISGLPATTRTSPPRSWTRFWLYRSDPSAELSK